MNKLYMRHHLCSCILKSTHLATDSQLLLQTDSCWLYSASYMLSFYEDAYFDGLTLTPEDIEEHSDASEAEDPNGEEKKCCV